MLNTIGFMDDVFDRFLVTVVILPQSSLMLPVQRLFTTWWNVNNDGDDATEHAFLNIMTNCKAITRFGCIIDRDRLQERVMELYGGGREAPTKYWRETFFPSSRHTICRWLLRQNMMLTAVPGRQLPNSYHQTPAKVQRTFTHNFITT